MLSDEQLRYALLALSDAADSERDAEGASARYHALKEAIGALKHKGPRRSWLVVVRGLFDDIPVQAFGNEGVARGFASTVPAKGDWMQQATGELGLPQAMEEAVSVWLYAFGREGLERAELIRYF